jgi:Ca2+-binding RTX toxin-like protein
MRTLFITTIALLATAGPASAAVTVSSANGEIRVQAAPGDRNDIGITSGTDYIAVTALHASGTAVGPGCVAATPTGVRCERKGVEHVVVELGDGNDRLGIALDTNGDPPISVAGGDGVDAVGYGNGPVTVTLDGKADDGRRGRDDIKPDVERVAGTVTTDTLTASDTGTWLTGGAGTDTLTGGAGNDLIDGLDFVDCESEGECERPEADTITCGDGVDRVDADMSDSVAADCEQIARAGVLTGTANNDRILGWRPAMRIFGLGGADRLNGAGNDTLDGGSGQDTLTAGSQGRSVLRGGSGYDLLFSGKSSDRLEGGSGVDYLVGHRGKDTLVGGAGKDHIAGDSGNDRIESRDHDRDVVRCGSGHDVVIADRRDRVFSDCERVIRRR